jgi:hypothetical protein
MLAWRLAETLPRAERRKLALRLIEADAEEIVFRRSGCTWTGFIWDRIVSGNLFAHGSIQGAEIEAVLAWMKRHRRFAAPRDVIIDVGANIGTSAIPFAKGTACQVVAIEPVPELHAMLCRNIAANGLAGRVDPIAAAIVSGRRKRVRMVLPSENSRPLQHFSSFIPVTALTGRARPRPIGELPAFCHSLGPMGNDVLLLGEGQAPRRANPALT